MNKYWAAITCTIIVCITVVLVFFNPYHYSMYGGTQPVRDNWMTGRTEVLTPDGWVVVKSKEEKIEVGDILKDGKVIKKANR